MAPITFLHTSPAKSQSYQDGFYEKMQWHQRGASCPEPAACASLTLAGTDYVPAIAFVPVAFVFSKVVFTSSLPQRWMSLCRAQSRPFFRRQNKTSPTIKSLWTTSYCVLMAGWALLVFSAFYYLLDGNNLPKARALAQRLCRPFVIYGMNALFLFALSGVLARMLGIIKIAQPDATLLSLQAVLYAPIKNLPLAPVNASLLFALLFNLAMFCIAWLMRRKRWFVKV